MKRTDSLHILIMLLSILVLMMRPNATFSQSKKSVKIEWKKVESALKYRINIQNAEGRTILDRETIQNSIEPELEPGSYQIRIGAANKLGIYSAWSEWSPLEIKLPIAPVFKKIEPTFAWNDQTKTELHILADNVFETTTLRLQSNTKTLTIAKPTMYDQSKLGFQVNTTELPTGTYRVALINPGDKISEASYSFEIKPRQLTPFLQNDSISLALAPQYLFFSQADNNTLLQTRYSFTFELYLDFLQYAGFVPFLNMGYISLLTKTEPAFTYSGYRIDAGIAYRFVINRRFVAQWQAGSGMTFIRLDAQFRKNSTEASQFNEVNLFSGVNVFYRLSNSIALFAGVEYLVLMDNFGMVSFVAPRAGLYYLF